MAKDLCRSSSATYSYAMSLGETWNSQSQDTQHTQVSWQFGLIAHLRQCCIRIRIRRRASPPQAPRQGSTPLRHLRFDCWSNTRSHKYRSPIATRESRRTRFKNKSPAAIVIHGDATRREQKWKLKQRNRGPGKSPDEVWSRIRDYQARAKRHSGLRSRGSPTGLVLESKLWSQVARRTAIFDTERMGGWQGKPLAAGGKLCR